MLTEEQIDKIIDQAECPAYSVFGDIARKACYTSSAKVEEKNIADWQLLYTVRNLKDNWIDDPRFQCLANKLRQ